MSKKCEEMNGDLTIILVYMNGDLHYTCGGKVIYAWINQFLKEKYTMKYMSGNRTEAINTHS